MPYGQIKVDEITFTNAGVDQTISVSGVVASISGNITATGTISGNVIRGGTLVSGATVTGTAGQFGTITGGTAGFTTVTGTTVTGTTANFVTVSGTTVTGTTAQFTTVTGGTAGFTTVTGTTITGTTLTVASGTFTGNSTAAAFIPTGSTVPTNGVYLPAANSVAISTNGTERLRIDSNGDLLSGTTGNLGYGGRNIILKSGQGYAGIASLTTESRFFSTWDSSAIPMTFFQGGSERMRLDTSGRLGVGTSSPAQLLHVSGSGTQAIRLENTLGTGNVNLELKLTNNTFTTSLNNTSIFYNDTAGREYIWYQNSAERMRLDTSGRLGIGTSAPQAQLQVLDRIKISDSTQAQGSLQLGDGASTSFNVGLARWNGSTNAPGAGGLGYFSQGTGNSGGHYFYTGDAAAGSQTARMTIAPGGNVGIGTTSPAYPIHVTGSGFSGGFFSNSSNAGVLIGSGSNLARISSNGSSCNLTFEIDATERARLDSSGRLLVGTSSTLPVYYNGASAWNSAFQVARSNQDAVANFSIWDSNASTYTVYGGAQIHLSACKSGTVGSHTSGALANGDSIASINFNASDGTNFRNAARIEAVVDAASGTADVPGRLVFSTTADGASSPTERMRIDAGGLIKIGTASTPTGVHAFNWQGANRMEFNNRDTTAGNCYGLVINYSNAAPNGNGNEFLYCQDNGNARFLVTSNGGIANFQANNSNLSDRNAKKDISPAADTWDCIKEWEIVHYRYKDQPDDADLNLGVIAQQVAESCPEVITVFQEAKDDQPEKLGVKEQQMYWMAIKALQEAQVRIEALEAEVAALKAQ